MLRTLARKLRRIGREPKTDGGVATAQTPDTTASPGIPPDERRCPNGCDAGTELVNVPDLIESEDGYECFRGQTLDDKGHTLAGRCEGCGEVHTNTAPRPT